jgi:predicted nucleotidyltransferase
MSTKGPLEALFPRTRLRELLRLKDGGLHLRELARRTKLDPSGLARELRRLEAAGIVTSQRVGRQLEYRPDPRCSIHDELAALLLRDEGVPDVIRRALLPLKDRIELAYIYGSFAIGAARAESDVDLMLVGAVSLREIAKPLAGAARTLGREITPTLLRPAEYRARLRETGGFIGRVHRAPKIVLIGAVDESH